ncbi:PAAR domain-containing protein [Stenotrophomonas sp. 169]|nr:PAAR domain-containing protein [Stenotrophomonas sp. 169]
MHRQGDHWVSPCKSGSCHDSVLAAGSASVFFNSKAIGRVGDPVACGSHLADAQATCSLVRRFVGVRPGAHLVT